MPNKANRIDVEIHLPEGSFIVVEEIYKKEKRKRIIEVVFVGVITTLLLISIFLYGSNQDYVYEYNALKFAFVLFGGYSICVLWKLFFGRPLFKKSYEFVKAVKGKKIVELYISDLNKWEDKVELIAKTEDRDGNINENTFEFTKEFRDDENKALLVLASERVLIPEKFKLSNDIEMVEGVKE